MKKTLPLPPLAPRPRYTPAAALLLAAVLSAPFMVLAVLQGIFG